jgi:predicted DNA-binding protein
MQEIQEMAPKSPKKIVIEFSASPVLIEVAKNLSQEWGKPEAEVNREAWERGLRAMVAEDNGLGVRRKLKSHPECIRAAIELLVSGGDPAEIKRLLEESIG